MDGLEDNCGGGDCHSDPPPLPTLSKTASVLSV